MTTNPWDVLGPGEGEKSPDALYISIGRALSEWEHMEQQFAQLFAFFCGAEHDDLPTRRAYGSVVAFKGRSDMLRSAAEAYFHSRDGHKMKDKFSDLLNLAGNLSPRRNEIAHGCVIIVYFVAAAENEEPTGSPTERMNKTLGAARWLLCPPEYATNKHALESIPDPFGRSIRRKYAYSSTEVDHYRREFRKLGGSIWDFRLEWSSHYPEDENILPPL